MYSRRFSEPMFPTNASPVFIPMPISIFGLPSFSHFFCNSETFFTFSSPTNSVKSLNISSNVFFSSIFGSSLLNDIYLIKLFLYST